LSIEYIVYLLRKTSLNLQDIGKLTPRQFNELLKELYFQEAQEEYRKAHSVASILAAIYNTIPKKSRKVFKAEDFLGGNMPTRQKEETPSVDELAKKKGINIPSK